MMFGGCIYFFECCFEELLFGEEWWLDGDEFWNNLYFIMLNVDMGKVEWEIFVCLMLGVFVFYLVVFEDCFVL